MQWRQSVENGAPILVDPGEVSSGNARVVATQWRRRYLCGAARGVGVLVCKLPIPAVGVKVARHRVDKRQVPDAVAVFAK